MPTTTTGRAMTARYRGTCTTCAAPIARGAAIVYVSTGLVYHAGACADARSDDDTPTPSAPRARRGGRPYYGAGPRARGRCEDAPCCGCCGTY